MRKAVEVALVAFVCVVFMGLGYMLRDSLITYEMYSGVWCTLRDRIGILERRVSDIERAMEIRCGIR